MLKHLFMALLAGMVLAAGFIPKAQAQATGPGNYASFYAADQTYGSAARVQTEPWCPVGPGYRCPAWDGGSWRPSGSISSNQGLDQLPRRTRHSRPAHPFRMGCGSW